MDDKQVPPRRIFRVSFTRADGTKFWRYVRCPYKTVGPEEWADSLVGMQNDLASLALTGTIDRFSISAVAAERTRAAATHSMRWHEFRAIALTEVAQ